MKQTMMKGIHVLIRKPVKRLFSRTEIIKRWKIWSQFNIYIDKKKKKRILHYYSRLKARFLSVFFLATPALLLLLVPLALLVFVPLAGVTVFAALAVIARLLGSPACFLGCGPSPGSGAPELPPIAWISVSKWAREAYSA